MIVVKLDNSISFIQAEIDDYFNRRRKIKVYNLNDEREARLIYILLHPSLWRSLKHRRRKGKRKDIQEKIFPEPIPHVKIPIAVPPPLPQPPKVQSSLVPKAAVQSEPKKNPLSQKKVPPTQFVPENIIALFGKSGDLELICPFCRDTLNFRFEDVDRKTFKNTRICNSCESINRASITVGNRFIFADFERYHPEIAAKIRKLENDEKDEFGNPIYTYSFPNKTR